MVERVILNEVKNLLKADKRHPALIVYSMERRFPRSLCSLGMTVNSVWSARRCFALLSMTLYIVDICRLMR